MGTTLSIVLGWLLYYELRYYSRVYYVQNFVMNDLTSALLPNDLRPSAGISMALHHKTGSAKISKIFYKANIEQTFEMADEIKANGVSKS